MTAKATRRTLLAAAVLVGIALLFWRGVLRSVERERDAAAVRARPPAPSQSGSSPIAKSAVVGAKAEIALSGVSAIADDLNAPGGTIRRDLEILNEVFTTWQTNFPRTGNPVGENAEITAALTGDNPVRFGFIPRPHRAINARGELVDRWGTPFRFHQLSGTQMEIRSAGPDQKFGTPDDAEYAPGSLVPVPR